jgi:hypothetical protein
MADDRKQSDKEMRQEARILSLTPADDTTPEAGLPSEARGLIGHHLREEYRRVLDEPLPDKFTKLLEELAKSDTQPETKPESKE